MTDRELDDYIALSAVALGLSIRPEWQAEVRENLKLLLLQGERVMGYALPDEAEAAPVFAA